MFGTKQYKVFYAPTVCLSMFCSKKAKNALIML